MTAEERCEKTDLIKTMCAHCLGHVEIGGTAVVVADGPSFVARLAGHCAADCERAIEPGDRIVRVLDSTAYAHEECAQ